MNILMLYTHNPSTTSGNIPMDLLTGFKKKGHKVRLVVNAYHAAYPDDIVSMETRYSLNKKNFLIRVRRRLGFFTRIQTDPKYHFFELDERKTYYKTGKILKKAKLLPDVIVVFFVKGFINSKNIYELYKQTNAPVFWVMYDMAPYTGGCHYAWECKGYQDSCGCCPGLFSSNPSDITFKNLSYKKNYLKQTDIHVLTGSEWQHRQLKQSALFKESKIHKIYAAFDQDVFSPVPKEVARGKYGIGQQKKVIFFGAFYLSDERKGMRYLLDSLKQLERQLSEDPELKRNILLLIAGNGFDAVKEHLPFAYQNLGMLDNNYGIASAYQAADIFVCPSIEDSGPTMINQSLLCGIPVVSFEMGVALDLVITGKTGYRARLKDSCDLAKGMNVLLSKTSDERQAMATNCRQLALKLFAPEVNINNWLDILTKNRSGRK